MTTPEAAHPALFSRLEARIGAFHLKQRILREGDRFVDPYRKRNIEEVLPVQSVLSTLLRISGVMSRGRENCLRFETSVNRVAIGSLPEPFHGTRILHLTDLHLGGEKDVVPRLREQLQDLAYDYCVFTGDFGAGFGDSARLRKSMTALAPAINSQSYCVLGNHDSIHMVPWMEDLGLRVLLNESVKLTRDDAVVNLAGVDDYHRFRLANLERALVDCGSNVTILLAHSPEQYRPAAYAGVALYLCGHTHGGQICLPNGFAPKLNIECGRQVGKGVWQFKDMHGYTSRGIGTSLVRARFNCPPEVVIHELLPRE